MEPVLSSACKVCGKLANVNCYDCRAGLCSGHSVAVAATRRHPAVMKCAGCAATA